MTTHASETPQTSSPRQEQAFLRFRRWNRSGVETIVAALLLVVIVVVMSAIVYAWSLGVFGAVLPTPPSGREILAVENQAFTSNNLTLFIRNTGTAVTTLSSYYVKDLNGDQYSRISWNNGPTMVPTGLGKAYILIPPLCSASNCPLTGSSFSFQPGNSYTITVITQRNNQFSFSIVY